MRVSAIVIAFALVSPTALNAQMAVSTFGATDAQLCYEDARDDMSSNADHCDEALKTAGMTERDRIATYVNRGLILNRAGRLNEALADFDEALSRDDGTAEAYLNRGNTYYLMRRYDEAIEDYRASLDYDLAKAHVAWYNIGLAYEAQNDPAKARSAYQTSLELNPDFGPAQAKLGAEPKAEG